MANICSTYLRIYLKEPQVRGEKTLTTASVISKLLADNNGFSYDTPIYAEFGPYGKYLDVVIGEKWGPSAVDDFYHDHIDEIEAVVYRFYDDGGDFDKINYLPAGGAACGTIECGKVDADYSCRYGFDTIIFESAQSINDDRIIQLDQNRYRIEMSGLYLSASEFRSYANPPAALISSFTIDNAQNSLFDFDRMLQVLKPEDDRIIELIGEKSNVIEYYFKARLVSYDITKKAYQKRGYPNDKYQFDDEEGNEWLYFAFDDWSNCLDPNYLSIHHRIMGNI